MSTSKSAETGSSSTFPGPDANDTFGRLKHLLQEMFQLDRGDLDFGLYRVMNIKAGEIRRFLDRDLLPQVKEVLAGIEEEERKEIEAQLDVTLKQLSKLKAPIENNPNVLELRAKLEDARADVAAEADVYRHLADFFGRYYREGDFMSLRRYSGGGRPTYLIPYDGEEVKLHWANADQYYIKTTENYATYTFVCEVGKETRRVRFEIAAADIEKDNIKEAADKQRRFVLVDADDAITLDGDDLVIYFEHRPLTDAEQRAWKGNSSTQQGRIDETIVDRILQVATELELDWRTALAAAAPTESSPQRTLLAKHITRYTTRNSFDYFIHKDLGGFLRREFDLYLKTEVLNIHDLAAGDTKRLRRALARMRAVHDIGDKVIAFLAQFEDFQKRLWLKKKFVLETHWCVTLDRVPGSFYAEIADNDAQRREWAVLFAIDESAGCCEPLNATFLKRNPHLVLDTRHFDTDFSDRLLAALSDVAPLDEQTDGLLMHGENFQALNLLQARYAGQVKCVYIDPPYNTENDDFIYKDRYKHSSWLTMMRARIDLCRKLLLPSGVFFASIDHHEVSSLKRLCDDVFDGFFEGMITWRRRHNQPNDKTKMIGLVSEYILSYANHSEKLRNAGVGKVDLTSNYSNPDNDPRGDWASKPWKTGSGQSGTRYTITTPMGKTLDEEWMGSPETYDALLQDDRIVFPSKGEGLPRKKYFRFEREEEGQCATNWWSHEHFGHNAGASANLKALFGRNNNFDNPKPVELVRGVLQVAGRAVGLMCDFFAGSGTTGHAVIDFNRNDGGNCKYVLVEVADHFDTVLVPRLKKVIYSPKWANGKPCTRESGVSQLMKYVRLESYEDTLEGLVVTPAAGDLLAAYGPELVEDYRLRYALSAETAASPCLLGGDFADPFAYTLSVVRDGVRRKTSADLPETFNYLLGLRVESRRRLDGVLAITGRNAQGQRCLVLWRNLEVTDNSDLERWFTDNRASLPDLLDLIYVNGDHTLNAIRQSNETWTAETIEPLFRKLMFEADER